MDRGRRSSRHQLTLPCRRGVIREAGRRLALLDPHLNPPMCKHRTCPPSLPLFAHLTLGIKPSETKLDQLESRAGAAGSGTRRSGPFRIRRYAWLAFVAVIGLAFAIILLTAGGHAHAPKTLGAHSPPLQVSTPVASRPLAAEFALLRMAVATPLPRTYLRAVQRAPAHYALMPSEARESSDGVWLIPGRNGLCVMMLDDEGVGGDCVSRAVAEREGVAFIVRNTRSGQELVTGAVPDGVVRVRALASNGATLATATPRSSIYRLTAKNIRKMSTDR